jgi:hypothetical protein
MERHKKTIHKNAITLTGNRSINCLMLTIQHSEQKSPRWHLSVLAQLFLKQFECLCWNDDLLQLKEEQHARTEARHWEGSIVTIRV